MNKIRLFLTLTGYQLTWLSCVFGESKFNLPFLGIIVGTTFIVLYFSIGNLGNAFSDLINSSLDHLMTTMEGLKNG